MLSKAGFAKLAGVSIRTLRRRLDEELSAILVGGSVDEKHPLAQWYVKNRGLGSPPAELVNPPSRRPAGGSDTKPTRVKRGQYEQRFGEPESVPLPDGSLLSIADIRDMPFGDVIDQWGWGPGFKEHLLALRALEEMRDKRLRVDERRGGLISRELVRLHVFGALDALHRRLLTDMPRTLALRVRVTETPEEGETLARREIERELKAAKAEVIYALKQIDTGAKGATQEDEE